jgi:hypothetical protein
MRMSHTIAERTDHKPVEKTKLPQLTRSAAPIHSPLVLWRIFFSVSRHKKW